LLPFSGLGGMPIEMVFWLITLLLGVGFVAAVVEDEEDDTDELVEMLEELLLRDASGGFECRSAPTVLVGS
jgi:hypothetical protein